MMNEEERNWIETKKRQEASLAYERSELDRVEHNLPMDEKGRVKMAKKHALIEKKLAQKKVKLMRDEVSLAAREESECPNPNPNPNPNPRIVVFIGEERKGSFGQDSESL